MPFLEEKPRFRGISLPPSGWVLVVLLVIYIFTGLIGHDPWKHDDALTIGIAHDGKISYALEGSIFHAGTTVQWLRDNLGLINSSHEIEALAEQVPDSEGVTLIPAFTGLAAPYWRPDATAQLVGMTRGTTKAHVARAALEAIALQVYDVLQAMQRHSPVTLTELRVDGGAANNNLLMQFQADILGVPVLRPTVTEITAKGVAIMAGQAMGLLMDSVIQESWQLERRFEPNMDETKRQVLLKRWQFYLQQSLKVLAT